MVEWIVSSVPLVDFSMALIRSLEHHGYPGRIAVTALTEETADLLSNAGADLILTPFKDAAKEAADVLAADLSTRVATDRK